MTATKTSSKLQYTESAKLCLPLLACPRCRRSLPSLTDVPIKCDACDFVIRLEQGIWRALPPERSRYFQTFVEQYETIRQSEGRGSSDSRYYLELPYDDISRKLSWQWQIRGRSYQTFECRVLTEIESLHPGGLDILDIGAGNCWLSHRVAVRAHRPVALDLLVNDRDGLGAAPHYLPILFPCFQADMDHLPFADAQFDLVVFNASLQYSTDYVTTLLEALRCLKTSGHLIVLDSPVYNREESGLAMRNERHQQFAQQHGFRSDSVPSREFITFDELRDLAHQLGLAWKIIRPWYGFRWALRPLKAKLEGKRQPSNFLVLWGQRTKSRTEAVKQVLTRSV